VKKAKRSRLHWFGNNSPFTGSLRFALLGLFILIPEQSIAADTTLLSIGPRYGFSGKEPVLGERQTETFDLVDVAATFRLPWSWPLGESPWSVETRLITSAGALSAAGDTGLIATIVPNVALNGWKGFVSIDAGVGLGFFSRYKYGTQDFGGPVQFVLTAALQIHPISRVFAGFRFQHFSDADIYGSHSDGSHSLGVDLYIIEVGYGF
jgi:Lipid A 3-O-deacylase (PagL)